MKSNTITKIIALIFCSIIFTSAIAAQDKPRASVFADVEYNDNEKNLPLVYDKLALFLEQLEKEPETTRGFIRIASNSELAEKLMPFISANKKVSERVLFYGKLKFPSLLNVWVGFYLVPIDAEIPYGSVNEPIVCPTLSIDAPSETHQSNSPLIFTAKVLGGDNESVITYHWEVSAGQIIEGQDTPTIKVNAQGKQAVMATVNIGGVDDVCMRETSFATIIDSKPELIESFGREIFDISQGRLDNFIAVLTNNPTTQGYVINYAGRFENKRAFAKRVEQIKTYFKFRADYVDTNRFYIDTSRLTFVNGGYRENLATELWMSFDENQKPVPTLTVDKRFVETAEPTRKLRR